MGEDFNPFAPDANKIHIKDIAHALSLMCRANGHFSNFYSVAQHSINCANEAKARGHSARIQTACLLHDASEAYLSDITRPVKLRLSKYLEVEKRLQNMIYDKFLGSSLSADEISDVEQIDHDMLVCEFNAMMRKKIFGDCPIISSKPSFEFRGFTEIEKEFLSEFSGEKALCLSKSNNLGAQIAEIENGLKSKGKAAVLDYVKQNRISEIFAEKLYIKSLSAQVDVGIHAYGILLALSKILEEDEVVESLSLGAGNTGKAFDVATSKRIAEFKFAKWSDSNNTIRQNGIFKDFIGLIANADNEGKQKFIYCLSAAAVINFLCNSERNLKSVLSRNPKNMKYREYQERYKTVKTFYKDFKDEVKIVELGNYIDMQ